MSQEPEKKWLGVVTVHMPCEFGYLRIARQNTRDFCARAGMSEFRTAQMEMAIDEACTNIVEHGYGNAGNFPSPSEPGIHMTMIQYEDRVEIRLEDYGNSFDFDKVPPIHPDSYLESNRQRGLGLFIIRNFVDQAEYTTNEAGANCLRLVKKLA